MDDQHTCNVKGFTGQGEGGGVRVEGEREKREGGKEGGKGGRTINQWG